MEYEALMAQVEANELSSLPTFPRRCQDHPHAGFRETVKRLLTVNALEEFPEWHHRYRMRMDYPQPPEDIIEAFVADLFRKLYREWQLGEYQHVEVVSNTGGFPDVQFHLRGRPFLGVEVKAGDVTAQEGKPTFRCTVSPEACAPQDLLAFYPYHWEKVFPRQGAPILLGPWVEEAKYAAAYRNAEWEREHGKGSIDLAKDPKPYPEVRTAYNDDVESDKGGNFGRLGRSSLMSQFLIGVDRHEYSLSSDLQKYSLARWRDIMWPPKKKNGS